MESNIDITEARSDSVRPIIREGSWSSKVNVWSDGTSYGVWGNVGRWNRPDNVWRAFYQSASSSRRSILSIRSLSLSTACRS